MSTAPTSRSEIAVCGTDQSTMRSSRNHSGPRAARRTRARRGRSRRPSWSLARESSEVLRGWSWPTIRATRLLEPAPRALDEGLAPEVVAAPVLCWASASSITAWAAMPAGSGTLAARACRNPAGDASGRGRPGASRSACRRRRPADVARDVRCGYVYHVRVVAALARARRALVLLFEVSLSVGSLTSSGLCSGIHGGGAQERCRRGARGLRAAALCCDLVQEAVFCVVADG